MPKAYFALTLLLLTLPLLLDSSYDAIKVGPFKIGGALRANYVKGDYVLPSSAYSGADRGAKWGDVELDTIRINIDIEEGSYIGKFEYRWYNGYSFIHTAFLGYKFEKDNQVEVGITRVPFGPGDYGISNSWFFDQHYYVGLSDDMDLGIKYTSSFGKLTLESHLQIPHSNSTSISAFWISMF